MRTAFIESLIAEAERDPAVWLVNADLGFSVLEPFAEKFPDRYLNVGVAEQNMIGVAAGLALSGYKVFVYSIGNFPTQRCLEQIRVDVGYHMAHVVVVAVGGGFSYGSQGYTHHAIEDLAVMRAIPNMRVAAPGDPHETRALVSHMVEAPGPGYLRLGRAGEPTLLPGPLSSNATGLHTLRQGADVSILTTGGILGEALDAAALLAKDNIAARVTSVPVLKPLPEDQVLDAVADAPLIVTVEEHSEIGGLRDTIAPLLARRGSHAPMLPLAVEDGSTRGVIRDQSAMRAHCGIDAASIARRVREALGR